MADLIETSLAGASAARAPFATLFGEEPEVIDRAMAGILPVMFASMAVVAAEGGAEAVFVQLQAVLAEGDPLDDVAASLSDAGRRAALVGHGRDMAAMLLGSQLGPVAAMLAGASGAKGDTVKGLLEFGGPLAAGGIGRRLGSGFGAAELAALLAAERPRLMAALPPGVATLLVRGAGTAADPTIRADDGATAFRTRWLPWVVAVVAAVGLVLALRGCKVDRHLLFDRGADAVVTAAPDQAPAPPRGPAIVRRMDDGRPALVVFFAPGEEPGAADIAAAAAPVKEWLDQHRHGRLVLVAGDSAVAADRVRLVTDALAAAGIARARIEAETVAGSPAADTAAAPGVEVSIRA